MLLQGCGFLPMHREESMRGLRLSSHVCWLSQGCDCFFNSSTSLTKAQICMGTCGLMVDCASTHLHACVYVVLQSGLCMSRLWPLLSSCIQGILIMCTGYGPSRSSDLFLSLRLYVYVMMLPMVPTQWVTTLLFQISLGSVIMLFFVSCGWFLICVSTIWSLRYPMNLPS